MSRMWHLGVYAHTHKQWVSAAFDSAEITNGTDAGAS